MASAAYNVDRGGLPDREMADRDDEFVGVGDGAVADLDDHVVLYIPPFSAGLPAFTLATRAPDTTELRIDLVLIPSVGW